MSRIVPGPAQGFASSAYESQYPHLWLKYLGPLAPWSCGRNCPDPSPARYDGAMAGSSSALSVVAGPMGRALKLNGNVSMQWNGHSTLGNKFKLTGSIDTMPIVLQAVFRYTHKTTAGHMMNLFHSDVPTVGEPYGYQLQIDANADKVAFTVYDGSAPSPIAMEWRSASGYLTPGKWHNFVAYMYAPMTSDVEIGQRALFWLDGVRSFPTETINRNAVAFSSALHSRLGGRTGGLDPDMEVCLLSIWNRVFAWREIDLLCTDPLAMFRRRLIQGYTKPARVVSLGGVTLKRVNALLSG